MAVAKAAKKYAEDPDAWRHWLEEFYAEHAGFVAEALCVSKGQAVDYCDAQRDEILRQGVSALESGETNKVQQLAEMALGGQR